MYVGVSVLERVLFVGEKGRGVREEEGRSD